MREASVKQTTPSRRGHTRPRPEETATITTGSQAVAPTG